MDATDPLGGALARRCLGKGAPLQLAEQRLEYQLCIANDRMLDLEILLQIVRVEGGVDEGLVRWHPDAEPGRGEAAADPEDHVGIVEEPTTSSVVALPPGPSASGWSSSNALFPCKLVVTGAVKSSASSRSSDQALA